MTFSIDRPRDISAALARARRAIESAGGYLQGDETSGRIAVVGVEGSYEVGSRVQISITKKPFIYPAFAVENQVRAYFQGA